VQNITSAGSKAGIRSNTGLRRDKLIIPECGVYIRNKVNIDNPVMPAM